MARQRRESTVYRRCIDGPRVGWLFAGMSVCCRVYLAQPIPNVGAQKLAAFALRSDFRVMVRHNAFVRSPGSSRVGALRCSASCLRTAADLPLLHFGEPFQELIDGCPALQVFEEGVYRHSCPGEGPSSADLLGVSFHCWAGAPVRHTVTSCSIVYSSALIPARVLSTYMVCNSGSS